MKMYDLLLDMCNPKCFTIEYCKDRKEKWCNETCTYAIKNDKLEKNLKKDRKKQ